MSNFIANVCVETRSLINCSSLSIEEKKLSFYGVIGRWQNILFLSIVPTSKAHNMLYKVFVGVSLETAFWRPVGKRAMKEAKAEQQENSRYKYKNK